jgi:glucosamine--fructose-6-phosphate aminotransferase (isomerizing)
MAATKTFLAEMLVLGMLAEALSSSTKQIDIAALADMLEEVITLAPQIDDLAGELKTASSLFIIARGVTLAVAREAECKLQESCFLNATAYAASDFRHGPLSLIEKGTKVLLMAPADETLSDVSALSDVLDSLGADLLLFTTDKEMAGKTKKSLLLPKSNRYMTPFAFSIASQLLACFLAGQKGINPDESRNILKYTMTK